MAGPYKKYYRMNSNGAESITGIEVVIPEFEDYFFFAYNLRDHPMLLIHKNRGWVVCELLTGIAVTDIDDPPITLKEALVSAKSRMENAKTKFYAYVVRSAFHQGLANPSYCGCGVDPS